MRDIQIISAQQERENSVFAFRRVLHTFFCRQKPQIAKWREARQVATGAELRDAPFAIGIANVQISASSQLCDYLLQYGFRFRSALFRKQFLPRLRFRGLLLRRRQTENQGETRNRSKYQPHSTAPPFTLRTSPVIKVARSEARNRIGPAISSGVAARPSGICDCTSFAPAFVRSTGFDMSVSTHPAATQLTSTRYCASSAPSDFTKLIIPPFAAASWEWNASPRWPALELMAITRPERCAIIF